MPEAKEPGFNTEDLKKVPTEATPPTRSRSARQSPSPDSNQSPSPEAPETESREPGDSFQEFTDQDHLFKRDPKALVMLISEGLSVAASLATWLARRRFGPGAPSFQPMKAESEAIAKPVARIISRKYNVKTDLNDAVDTVGTGAALMNYIERVVAGPPPRAPQRDDYAERPARQPAPESRYVSEEREYYAAEERAASAPSTAPAAAPARAGKFEVGSGPVRAAYLEGYE